MLEPLSPENVAVRTVGNPLRDAGIAILVAGRQYWEEFQRVSPRTKAVVWLEDDDGSLVVFTRGEYGHIIKGAISEIDLDAGGD